MRRSQFVFLAWVLILLLPACGEESRPALPPPAPVMATVLVGQAAATAAPTTRQPAAATPATAGPTEHPPTAAANIPLPARHAYQFTPSTGYAQVAVWDTTLAWGGTDATGPHTTTPNAWILFTYDLTTQQEHSVARSRFDSRGQILPVQLSAHWIVWMDYLAAQDKPEIEDWFLQALDRRDNSQVTIAHKQPNSKIVETSVPEFSLDGDTVAWTELESRGNTPLAFLNVFDLETMQKLAAIRPDRLEADLFSPHLDQHRIVWQELLPADQGSVQGSTSRIILADLTGSHRLQLNQDEAHAFQPTILGDYAAWKVSDSLFDLGSIVLLCISSKERQVVWPDTNADQPVLTRAGLSWSSVVVGKLLFYNLVSRQIETLDTGEVGKTFAAPSMIGWFWADTKTDPQHIQRAIKVIRFGAPASR